MGSGGVMLPHYSPFKVAEAFSLLAGLFPGRIDLGLGRAAGTDALTMYALQRDRRQASPDDFPQQLAELLAHLEDDLPSDHPFAHLAASLPGRPEAPEPWLLGSSPQSGIWAAQLGLPYAFADFINRDGAGIATDYQRAFDPGPRLAAPRVAVATWALAADTEEEAWRLAASSRMAMAMLRRGRLIPVPPVDQALRFLAAEGEPAQSRRITAGTPEQVRSALETLAQQYGADEVIVVTITFDHAARRRSYELLAEAFGLACAAAARRRRPARRGELRLGRAVGACHLVNVASAAVFGGHATLCIRPEPPWRRTRRPTSPPYASAKPGAADAPTPRPAPTPRHRRRSCRAPHRRRRAPPARRRAG